MPRWIIISNRIIAHIRVPIPSLDSLTLFRNECIRLCETSEGRVIPAGVVENETEAIITDIGRFIIDIGVLSRIVVV
jgi:hypothetical protein